MTTHSASTAGIHHHLRRMIGRDPHEAHRAATPLELLFDLAFVVAFAQAGEQLAHLLAEGHVASAVGAFGFAMFAICWAWMNFSWFASGYDTDDWFFRAATMVQMVGVLILALGMPALFHSIDEGHAIDNRTIVAGYIIMRVAIVALWLRVATQDPARRNVALRYACLITLSQIGWVLIGLLHLGLAPMTAIVLVLFIAEAITPVLAERGGDGTPWHAHHLAERYGLLTIIALGEGVFGTVTTVSAVVEGHGWSREAVTLVVAGIGLTFGLWWNYFMIPSANVLTLHRSRVIAWAYEHMPLFAAIAATGAGLHVAAYVIEGEATISVGGAVLAVAVPVFVFLFALYALYSNLLREFDQFHLALFAGSIAIEAAAVVLAFSGAPLDLCLFLVTLAPFVTVVGYETIGHRHAAAALARVSQQSPVVRLEPANRALETDD